MRKGTISLVLIFLASIFFSPHMSYATGRVVDLSSPPDGHIFIAPTRPTLSWVAVSGAIKYQIQVALSEFLPGTYHCDVDCVAEEEVTSTSYQMPSELEVDGYYWRVRAMVPDSEGMHRWQPWSPVWFFEIIPPPEVRRLELPEDGSYVDSPRPLFRWVDPYQYGEHIDKIQVSTDPSFSTVVFEEEITTGLFHWSRLVSPVDLEPGQSYYWRVRFESVPWAEEEIGITLPGPWSEVSQFEVFLSPPPEVYLIASTSRWVPVSSPATFTWNPVPTATGYLLQISDSEDFSNIILRLFPTTNSITTPLRFPDGRYYWRVRARNASGYGEWSQSARFEKFSSVPIAVDLIKPENGAVVHNIRPLFEWKTNTAPLLGREDTHRFHLQVSKMSNFATTVIDKSDIPREGHSFHLYPPIDLSPRTYYWRVRERNIAGWGPWSEVRSFNIDLSTTSSARVTLSRPSDGATLNERDQTFIWSLGRSDWQRYHFQISETSDFATLSYESVIRRRRGVWPSVTIWLTYELENDKTYYWRVRAEDEIGWGPWSEVRSFHVVWPREFVYGALRLYEPEGLVRTSRPEFSWEECRDPYGHHELPFSYHIQVATSDDFVFPIIDKRISSSPFRPSQNLSVGYTYYWRVRAIVGLPGHRWSNWTNPKSFWIAPFGGGSVTITLVSPEDNAALRTTRPRFSWRDGGRGFELEVSRHRDFSTSIFRTPVRNYEIENFLSPQDLTEGTYFWHVRPKFEEGAWGHWSQAKSFTIDLTPPEIRILSSTERKISTSTLPARAIVYCEVTDNLTGVKKVEYYLGGRRVAQRTRPHHDSTYIADIPGLNEGRNSITIMAYDKSGIIGNISQAPLTLEVERVLGLKERPSLLPKGAQGLKPSIQRQIQRQLQREEGIQRFPKR